MDLQDSKLENIEKLNKNTGKQLTKFEVELKRKMLSTLNEVNTLKEEIDHSLQIVKRDKYQVIKIGNVMEEKNKRTLDEVKKCNSDYKEVKEKVNILLKGKF